MTFVSSGLPLSSLNYADKKAGVFQESRDILITLTFLSTFLLVTILGAAKSELFPIVSQAHGYKG